MVPALYFALGSTLSVGFFDGGKKVAFVSCVQHCLQCSPVMMVVSTVVEVGTK